MSNDVAYHSLITPKVKQRGWGEADSPRERAEAWLRSAGEWLGERTSLVVVSLFGVFVLISLVLLSTSTDLVSHLKPHSSAVAAQEYRALFHELPDFPRLEGDINVLEAKDRHVVTVIELHGLGGQWYENPFRGALAEVCPYIKWVSPQARISNITVRGGEPTTAWFNIETFADLYQDEDEAGMIESQREIHALIEQERQVLRDLGREPRIVLAGFSQGAVMSLLASLTAEEPIEAALLLSGYLPLVSRKELLGPLAHKETKLWWGHGRNDPYLTVEKAAESVEILRSDLFGLDQLVFNTYPNLDHYWSYEEMAEMRAWVQENVAAQAGVLVKPIEGAEE